MAFFIFYYIVYYFTLQSWNDFFFLRLLWIYTMFFLCYTFHEIKIKKYCWSIKIRNFKLKQPKNMTHVFTKVVLQNNNKNIFRQNKKNVFSVTERSEDIGLVYPLSVVRRAKRSVHHERLLLFWRAVHDRRKTNIGNFRSKKKLSRQIKKCVKKVCQQN